MFNSIEKRTGAPLYSTSIPGAGLHHFIIVSLRGIFLLNSDGIYYTPSKNRLYSIMVYKVYKFQLIILKFQIKSFKPIYHFQFDLTIFRFSSIDIFD